MNLPVRSPQLVTLSRGSGLGNRASSMGHWGGGGGGGGGEEGVRILAGAFRSGVYST